MSRDREVLAYARGELSGLEARRFEAALGNDQELARIHATVRAGLAYAPEGLADEHRERLFARLEPYAAAPGRHFVPAFAVAFAAALALIVTGLVVFRGAGAPIAGAEARAERIVVVDSTGYDFSSDAGQELEFSGAGRAELTPFVHAIFSPRWRGRVDGDAKDTNVDLESGRISLAFRGGEGRRLSVSTPEARVVVVGTRFSVARHRASTEVVVAEGEVSVFHGRQRHTLVAGQGLRVGAQGAVRLERNATERRSVFAAAQAALSQPFLRDWTGSSEGDAILARKATSARKTSERESTGVESIALEDALAILERGDAAGKRGDHRGALKSYVRLLAPSVPEAMRQVAALAVARSYGALGARAKAETEFLRLAKSGGEVGRQAQLGLCELDSEARPCTAFRCAEALARSADAGLAKDAELLLHRFEARGLRCR